MGTWKVIQVIPPPPGKTASEFDCFFLKIKKFLHQINQPKSFFIVILADFNAISKSW